MAVALWILLLPSVVTPENTDASIKLHPLTSKPQGMKETKPSASETSHEPPAGGRVSSPIHAQLLWEPSRSETPILGICTELIIIEVARIPQSVPTFGGSVAVPENQ